MSELKTTYDDDITTMNAIKYDLDDLVDTFLNPQNVNKNEWNFFDKFEVENGKNIKNDLEFFKIFIFPTHDLVVFLESKPINKLVWLNGSMESDRLKVIQNVEKLLCNLELYSCLCKLFNAENTIQSIIVARFVQELLKLINSVKGSQTDECLHVNIDIEKKMDNFKLKDLIISLLKLVEQDYVAQKPSSNSLKKEDPLQNGTPQSAKIEVKTKQLVIKIEEEINTQVKTGVKTKPQEMKKEAETQPQVVMIEETEVYVNFKL
jgi:hypothetical protein